MVTKGYRKGVYDRVTEGTWEWNTFGNQSLVVSRKSLAEASQELNGWLSLLEKSQQRRRRRTETVIYSDPACFLRPCQGRESENQNSQQGGPGQAANDMPNHKAHRVDPPRGGNREWIFETSLRERLPRQKWTCGGRIV